MEVDFPYKQTENFDLMSKFKAFITKNMGGEKAFQQGSEAFQQMHNLRQ